MENQLSVFSQSPRPASCLSNCPLGKRAHLCVQHLHLTAGDVPPSALPPARSPRFCLSTPTPAWFERVISKSRR